VRSADVYVGIFAWRYGYVPRDDNPHGTSVTELELREAERLGKPRLVFVLKGTAPWPPNMMDVTTGENERGARIAKLRDELMQERLAGIFETADELATKVVTALYGWQIESSRDTAVQAKQAGTVAPKGVEAKAVAAKVAAAGETAAARATYPLLWRSGSRLRVRFLNGPPILHRRVLRLAQIWTAYANITFEPSDDEAAEVRVAFDEGQGSWSYEGTTCLAIDTKEKTVNFGWLRVDSPLDELEAVVVHEFGHVLGLAHEHSNPDSGISWNVELVYKEMSGPPNHWDRAAVDATILATWERNRFPFSKPFDPFSVMAFPIPATWTKDNFAIGRNVTISPGDREFISRLYPYDDVAETKPPAKQPDNPRERAGPKSRVTPPRRKNQS
jgi:hypothetical protein